MSLYRIDLHVHSPASHCFSGDKSSAPLIIERAKEMRLDMIAVTDHHSASGIREVQRAAKNAAVTVLPGMELTCRIRDIAEVFLLALFSEDFPIESMERQLRSWQVPPEEFGNGGFVVPVPAEQIIFDVRSSGGLIVSARSDKTEYRRKVIPDLLRMGVKLFDLVYPRQFPQELFQVSVKEGPLWFFAFSDSHSPAQVGSRSSEITLSAPVFKSNIKYLADF